MLNAHVRLRRGYFDQRRFHHFVHLLDLLEGIGIEERGIKFSPISKTHPDHDSGWIYICWTLRHDRKLLLSPISLNGELKGAVLCAFHDVSEARPATQDLSIHR